MDETSGNTTPSAGKNLHSLHDCLSLGEVELGLSQTEGPSDEEGNRLPLLLRLLANSRPLSSIPTLTPSSSTTNATATTTEGQPMKEGEDNQQQENATDPVIQRCVDRLEDKAAVYSAAEGVEIVTCHLAPLACRRISRLNKANLDDLEMLASHPSLMIPKSGTSSKKRKITTTSGSVEAEAQADAMQDEESDVEPEQLVKVDEYSVTPLKRSRHQMSSERDSLVVLAKEDSQEATVAKTLSELVLLVVQSLKHHETLERNPRSPPTKSVRGEDVDDGSRHPFALSVSLEDSILAEEGSRVDDGSTVCDLPSTAAALLHHVPVLGFRATAAALCRAAVPQTPAIIARLGANTPAGIPCLIRGCIQVYRQQIEGDHMNALSLTAVRNSLVALANLSQREKARIRSVLQLEQCLVDLQLELALSQSALEMAGFVTWHMARNFQQDGEGNIKNLERSIEDANARDSTFHGCKPLHVILHESSDLMQVTLEHLCAELGECRDQKVMQWGRVCIFLTAMAWVLLNVPSDRLLEKKGTKLIALILSEIQAWTQKLEKLEKAQPQSIPLNSALDRPIELLLCVAFAALAMAIDSNHEPGSNFQTESCSCLLALLEYCDRISSRISALSIRIRFATARCELSILLEGVLRNEASFPLHGASTMRSQRRNFVQACELLLLHFSNEGSLFGPKQDVFDYDPATGLDLVRDSVLPDRIRADGLQVLLKHVLDNHIEAVALLRCPQVPLFIEEATSFLRMADGPVLPIILPIQVERLGNSASFQCGARVSVVTARFILCLLYSFALREIEGNNSPYVVDFRVLPLIQTRCLCEAPSEFGLCRALATRLGSRIDQFCPEMRSKALSRDVLSKSSHYNSGLRPVDTRACEANLVTSLRRCLDNPEANGVNVSAEASFLIAKDCLSESSLITTTASNLLSEPNAPPPFLTHAGLCRDPLLILKFPIRLFHHRGLRRIMLSLLNTLLETNDCIVREFAPTDEVRYELLDARNELVVRSLISIMSSTTASERSYSSSRCSLTCSILRKMIAKNLGLTAVLLKQGLSETSVDWLAEAVPECLEDAFDICKVMTESNSLGAPERLVLADSVLRLAIMQGDISPHEMVRRVVFSALAQLVASFFLVLGPTGVPVSTLLGAGYDATIMSRKAAFRMLRVIPRVQTFRSEIRNECNFAIQKLLGACKGENIVSGLPGALATQQKSLVKELIDSLTRASNAIGGGS